MGHSADGTTAIMTSAGTAATPAAGGTRARSLARRVFEGGLRWSGLLPVAKHLDRTRTNVLRVLLYHRIADRQASSGDPGLISASPTEFERQMEYVARHYHPVDATHAIEAVQHHGLLPPRAVLVTFDDGYTDFVEHAWPILQRCGVPAVLFVPTAFPDSRRCFWWDVVHDVIARTSEPEVSVPGAGVFSLRSAPHRVLAIQRLASDLVQRKPGEIEQIVQDLQAQLGVEATCPTVMTWRQIRRLAGEGLTVGSHARTHPAVPALTGEEIEAELSGAQADIVRELGEAPALFAFPFGLSERRALPVLRRQGIEASFTAFTPHPALNIAGQVDPLLLRREAVNGTTSFVEFCLSLTSLYTSVQSTSLLRAVRRQVREWTASRPRA